MSTAPASEVQYYIRGIYIITVSKEFLYTLFFANIRLRRYNILFIIYLTYETRFSRVRRIGTIIITLLFYIIPPSSSSVIIIYSIVLLRA